MSRLSNITVRFPLFLAFLLVAGCGDFATEGALTDPVVESASARGGEKGKPGGDEGDGGESGGETGGDPIVDATDPPETTQDTTLDVVVLGDNFEPGSVAEFLLDETVTADITTNETRFVNKKRLVANITVSADAPTELYDVRVKTPPGRKGVGLEIFKIAAGIIPLQMTIAEGSLIDDGHGPYIDWECGEEANWQVDPSFVDFRPARSLNRKQERDFERDPACDGRFPREARIDLHNAVVRSYCAAPVSMHECVPPEAVAPDPGTTLSQLAAMGVVDAPDPDGNPISTLAARIFDAQRDGDAATAPGGLNTPYCLDDGRGRPLRFDPERNPGSYEFLVRLGPDGQPLRVESQGGGRNVGSCAHTRSDGTIVVLNLELDIAVDFVRID